MGLFLLAAVLAAGDPQDRLDLETLRERLKDPAEVFPVFRELLQAGRYSDAHTFTLSPKTKSGLPYEAFYPAMTTREMSYDVSKRLLASLRVHRADPAAGVLRLCSPEFGFSHELRLTRFVTLWVLDFTRDELEAFIGTFASRALAWHRHQVKRADGWHFAYPPDWTYAPLARTCVCGK